MTDMQSVVLYLVFFAASALLMYWGRRRNFRPAIILSLAIPIILGGIRYMVGTDYAAYVDMADSAGTMSLASYFTNNTSGVELSFYIMAQVSSLLVGSSWLYFFMANAITVLFFYFGLKRYKIEKFALVYFMFLLIILPITFNLVRQGIALSIVFYAFSFIMTRDWKRYLAWVIVAGFFHASALLVLPAYLLGRYLNLNTALVTRNLLKIGLTFVGIVLLLPFIFNLLTSVPFFEKYVMYQTVTAEGANNIFVLKVAILGLLILASQLLVKKSKIMILFIALSAIDLALSSAGFISPFLKRIALYFSFFHVLALAQFPLIFKDKFGKYVAVFLLIAYGVAYFYISFYVLGQSDIIPYETIFGVKNV